jgi:predicted membrane metal-binding protein
MTCSPWFVLYAVTAILWATYSARMARQEYGSDGRWCLSFAVNLLLCPVAILWASIWKAHAGSHRQEEGK